MYAHVRAHACAHTHFKKNYLINHGDLFHGDANQPEL